MCDTLVVVESDRVLFAKNSDRNPNEAQLLDWQPRREHPADAHVQCTHIEIPQARETHAVLLSRPFWMWGAEIGSNEHGVTIGNEAVFTREPYEKTGLTGMDLLRLALERSASAEEAVEVICRLLTVHGQGGGCGHEKRDFTYHNSYLVADPSRAFVLETAGRLWTAEEVRGVRSISNGLTLPEFRAAHADRFMTWGSHCDVRRARTLALAESANAVGDLFAILRDHGDGNDAPKISRLFGGLGAPCVHAGGLADVSQTTASWVAALSPGGCQHWVTATSAPCMSLFKPVRVDEPLDLGPEPTDVADDQSLWWRHERLHRRVLRNQRELLPLFSAERDRLEAEWLDQPPAGADAFAEGDRLLADWQTAVDGAPRHDARPGWLRRLWARRNQMARLNMDE